MSTIKFVYWQDDDAWLGHLQDYPDYWTQGETLDDLKEHLADLYRDISSGQIPGIRKVAELTVAVKRVDLIREIEQLGCVLIRHGAKHDWYQNPRTGVSQAVPRHREIKEHLARHIIRMLSDSEGS